MTVYPPKQIAVIIPCYNEEQTLGKTLVSVIEALSRGGTHESAKKDIFVVDDCSSDKTSLIASEYGVNVIRNNISLKKAGSIQRAIKDADMINTYRFISIIDADSIIDPIFYMAMVRAFDAKKDAVLASGHVVSIGYNHVTAYRALEYASGQYFHKDGQSRVGAILVAAGCASVWRSKVFKSLTYQSDTLIEDMDLTMQVTRQNLGSIIYVKNAIVRTQDPRTYTQYIKQVHRWWSGTWQVIVKHDIPWRCKKIDLYFAVALLDSFLFAFNIFLFCTLLLIRLITSKITFEYMPVIVSSWSDYFILKYLILTEAYIPTTLYGLLLWQYGIILYGVLMTTLFIERRRDIIVYWPLFIINLWISSFVFVWTFFREVILKRKHGTWFSPTRY